LKLRILTAINSNEPEILRAYGVFQRNLLETLLFGILPAIIKPKQERGWRHKPKAVRLLAVLDLYIKR